MPVFEVPSGIADAGTALAWLRGMRRPAWIIVSLLVLGLGLWSLQRAPVTATLGGASSGAPAMVFSAPAAPPAPAPQPTGVGAPSRLPAFLPAEAQDVLQRIARGGPFDYRQDGSVFQNREHRLPPQPSGYYHEYTVATPGSPDRGARRIITGGGEPGSPGEYWYTGDHYRSFQRFEVSP
jgi:ribonuclease T1